MKARCPDREELEVRDDERVAGTPEEDRDECQEQPERAQQREQHDGGLPIRGTVGVDVAPVDERERDPAEGHERRHHHARHGGMEVGEQLLQPEEVPGGLGDRRRDVAVGKVLERGVDEQAHQQQQDAHHGRREELDADQVRPGHDRVVGLLLDPHDGVLLDQGQQAVRARRHRHPLLVDLGPSSRVDRQDHPALGRLLRLSHGRPAGR